MFVVTQTPLNCVKSSVYRGGAIVAYCLVGCQPQNVPLQFRRAMESLSEYVQRIMKEKNLKVPDVVRRSNGGIGETYLTSIVKGEATNLTVEKIKALALGLGVDEVEVCYAACGVESKEWTPRTLLTTMDKIVASPELTEILKALMRAKSAKLKAVKKLLERD